MRTRASGASRSIRRHVLAAMTVGLLVVSGLGGWATTTELSGAVVASGMLVVDSNVKKVQHPTGGVVGELRVRDGVRVSAGDVVIRLDETITRANLAIVIKGIDELTARQVRLEAERDDESELQFPNELTSRMDNPDVSRVVNGERKLFHLRRSARAGQKAQLKERIGQLKEEILGLAEQAEAKKGEIEWIIKELEGVRQLWSKNLVPIMRLTQLEREAVRLKGERGQLIASTAQAKGKITETELQVIQIDQDLRSEVAKELREIQGKMAELVERKVTAEDQLMRTEIRAPQSGVVHQLSVHTVGGVIVASEPAMLIVPESDDLTVEVKLPPQNIDQLMVGQPAVLRFSAFNQRTTPEINGSVVRISGDIILDQKSGATYYLVHIATPVEEIARLEGLKLVPGMPVEAFIQTEARTVLSYLIKPLHDQILKAFRER
ncbi:MAG TPA: HlyD family type I secretion periplasmic adaptor subunit [Xanthobacteraceae bacterium]|nr:HlyD family type I secretion periplasmic adaptor subunit [Xanthobacteraceae bacterium]